EYEALRLGFLQLGRVDTDQVYERGALCARLHELAPDQKDFTRRAKAVLGLSRRGAENYANVYLKLEPFRERLVKVGMIASGLYELATAEPDQVEQVLAASEAGEVLTLADIKQRLGRQAPVATPDD